MTIPTRITDEARKLSMAIGESPSSQATILELSSALLAAEQRGREMEREAVAMEREACASICDVLADREDVLAIEAGDADLTPIYRRGERIGNEAAAAIRSRTTEG